MVILVNITKIGKKYGPYRYCLWIVVNIMKGGSCSQYALMKFKGFKDLKLNIYPIYTLAMHDWYDPPVEILKKKYRFINTNDWSRVLILKLNKN